MPFPNIPTSEEARNRAAKAHAVIRRKREARKSELSRLLSEGECLKRAAYDVGVSYWTARQYRREV